MIDYTMKSFTDSLMDRPINVNKTFFYITMIFIAVGFASYIATDLKFGNPVILGADFIALAFFVSCFVLVHRRKVNPSLVLLMCFAMVLFLCYLGFFFMWYGNSNVARIWDEISMNMLLTGVLGASCGLVLLRHGAWVFMILGAGFVLGLLSMPMLVMESGRMIFMGILMALTLMMVFYFRTSLEKLIGESSSLIAATRFIKEKQERQNEENRPFVYFGQNSVGLVVDFSTDVDRMQEHLNVLKLKDCDHDEQVRILQHMEEQARSLSRRIDLVTFITSAGPERPAEQLKIQQVFDAALYPFRINPGICTWVSVTFETPADLDTHDRRFAWLRLVEMIMRQTLRPEMDQSRPLFIKFLLTGSRDTIRVAYHESRPCFFAAQDESVRSRFHNRPIDMVRAIVQEDLVGHIESLEPDSCSMVILVPRRSRT